MNNFNISDENLTALLELAGKKLGKNPQELKQQLESGQIEDALGSMDPAAAGKVNALLQNPKALEAMLGNDKIKNMLSGMMGGQK